MNNMDAGTIPDPQQNTIPNQALMQQLKSGAGWFYLIGGLSIVNSFIIAFEGNTYFVVGLGINHMITGFLYGMAGADFENVSIGIKMVVLLVTAIVASVFFLFGYFANKKISSAFIIGMVLYALDALVFLIVNDFMSIGFHVFALFFIFRGYLASQKLKRMEDQARIAQSGLAQPIK
jgi:hypothetical protein